MADDIETTLRLMASWVRESPEGLRVVDGSIFDEAADLIDFLRGNGCSE